MASMGSEDGDVGFQIAPMVDVVFVLLLFFMASAGSQVIEKELNISLPSGQSPDRKGAPISTPIIIEITGTGEIFANSNPYDTPTSKELPKLRGYLKETMDRFGGKDPVIIKPSPDTKQERIIDVLNAASHAGVTKLTFG